jgi:hypothetical protein
LADFLFNHVLVTVFDKRKRTVADMERDEAQEEAMAQQDLAHAQAAETGPSTVLEKDVEALGDSEETLVELESLVEERGGVFDFAHIEDPKARRKMFRSEWTGS